MNDHESTATGDSRSPAASSRLKLNSRVMTGLSFVLIALIGGVAALLVFSRTDEDPLDILLGAWPVVLIASLVYAFGMLVYSASWAALFDHSENRKLIALAFLISQPVKYLPGGIAQPVGQVALTAQVTNTGVRTVVAFPVHVIINVVAALTLSSPLLFIVEVPNWSRWAIVLVPLLWAALDRRWMSTVLNALGRLHRVFRVSAELPAQEGIHSGFRLALAAHASMFLAFGVLTAASVPGWSMLSLALAYGLAWAIGYIALPAPAGLGAREAVLALLLAPTLSTLDVVKISAVHRAMTLAVELTLLIVALVLTRSALKARGPARE